MFVVFVVVDSTVAVATDADVAGLVAGAAVAVDADLFF